MDDLTRPQRRRESLRRRIIEEAVKLYHENGGEEGGVQATTVERICERADISVRTFFRYFESKLDVIYLDFGRAYENLRKAVLDRLQQEPPEQALLTGSIDNFSSFVSEPVNRDRFVRAMLSPHFAERRAKWRSIAQEGLIEMVEPRLPEGPHRQLRARVMVTAIRGAIDDVTLEWSANPDVPLSELVHIALDELRDVAVLTAAALQKGRFSLHGVV